MPTYRITAPDGKTYQIDGPAGASQEDVKNEVMRQNPYAAYTTEELKNAPTASTSTADFLRQIGQGGISGAKSLTDLFGAGTDSLSKANEYLEKGLSPQLQEEQRINQEILERAKGKGILGELSANLRPVFQHPFTSTGSAIASSVPMIAGSVLAEPLGLATAAELGIGSLMGLGGQKGQNYQNVHDEAIKQGKSEQEAEALGQQAAEYSVKNLPSLAAGALSGALEGPLSPAAKLGRYLRPGELAEGAIKNIPKPTFARALGTSALEGGLGEYVQGSAAQLGSNLALQNAGFDTPLMEGVMGAGAHDALIGALTGAAVSPAQLSSLKREYDADQAKILTEEAAKKQKESADLLAKFNEQNQINPELLALPAPAPKVEGNQAEQSLFNPHGNYTAEELGPERVAAIDAHRADNGKPPLKSYSIEDIVDAMPSQSLHPADTRVKNPEGERADLNALIANKVGHTNEKVSPQDVVNKAIERNVDTSGEGFKDFLRRTTGIGELNMMTDGQRFAAQQALQNMEPHTGEAPLILPRGTNATHYDADQRLNAINALDQHGGPVSQEKAIETIKKATGLERDQDAQHMIAELVRSGDFDLNKDNELEQPSSTSYLPPGYHIEEGSFKEGEAPEHFKIMAADKELGIADTQEAAEEKKNKYLETRAKKSENIDKEIEQKQADVQKSKDDLEAMEAMGEGRTPAYQKASADHAALETNTQKEIGDLNRTKSELDPEVNPLSIKAGNIVPKTRKGFTIFKNNQSIGTFPDRSTAEKTIAANLTTKELEQLTGDKRRRSFARLADQELNDRVTTGIKVKVTKEFEQAAPELGKQLEAMLAKFGLKGVGLKLMSTLGGNEGEYAHSLIKIALDITDPIGVLRHESVHALKALGFFTDNQWNALRRMAKDKWIKEYLKDKPFAEGKSRYDAYMEMYKGDMNAIEEEAIADAFRDFAKNGSPPGMIAALIKRLNEFFEAIKNVLSGNGFNTANDVFEKIEKGELVAGEVKNKPTQGKFSFKQYSETVPKEPGTTPIKEGYVRLYHQTDGDNLRQIEKEGLLLERAKGIEGPKAIYAGETPFYGEVSSRPTLEFQVPKKDWDAPFVLRNVKPEDFISAHYPWHKHARYLEDKEGIANVLSGRFDDIDPNTDSGKAVKYIKDKYSNEEGRASLKSPLEPYVSAQEAQERIQRRINRPAGVGLPTNQRTEFTNENGQKLVVGKITHEDWLNRVNTLMDKEEIKDSRNWYKQLHELFEPLFGAKSSDYALAWLLSQQRASPTKGLTDVLRASDIAQGKQKVMGAGLNEQALIDVLSGRIPKSGVGAKLLDFIDSELGLPARTYMKGDVRGRQPAAIDVWAQRDIGFVDPTIHEYIRKTFGEEAAKSVSVDKTVNGESQYEHGIDFYNDVVDMLNKKNYMGGGWTAREVQAVGWVTMQRALGIKAEFVRDIVNGNTRRISIGLAPGGGSVMAGKLMGKEIPVKSAQKVIDNLAKIAGIKVIQNVDGVGAYLTYVEGAIQIDAIASPESVADFMDMVGYAFQQTEIINTRALASGKNMAIDVMSNGLDTSDKAVKFFTEFLNHVPQKGGDPIAAGFQQITVDGKNGIRLLNFGGNWRQSQVKEIQDALNKTSILTDTQINDVVVSQVVLSSTKNDWKETPNGNTYLDSLRTRGRLQEAQQLQREYPPSRFDLTEDQGITWGGTKYSLGSTEPTVRPSNRSNEGITLGNQQEGAVSYSGIHYGKEKTDVLKGSKYGSGLRGAERRRLEDHWDDRVKNRVYFYIPKTTGEMPQRESGLGGHVYTQKFNNILGPGKEMSRIMIEARENANEFESAIVDAGYDGYAVPNMGMMVILNHDVPVKYEGTVSEVAKASLKAPNTPAFKHFFGDSKVVDKDGNPLVVSHISKANPTVFDNKYKTDLSSMGFHFGTKEQAQFRGTQYDFKSNLPTIGNYYLSIQNPLEVSHMESYAPDHLADKMMDMDLITEEKYDSIRDKYYNEPDVGAALVKILQKAGYDGLVYSNEMEGEGNSYVPFKSTQIKSATENKGTFDVTNPDVRASLKAPNTKEFKRFFGDSKIVDKAGKPMVMYHATNADFNTFRRSNDGKLGEGIYSTSIPEYSNEFAPEGNVMPLYAHAENPFVINVTRGNKALTERFSGDINKAMIKAVEEFTDGKTRLMDLEGNQVRELFEKNGYDGIMVKDDQGNIVELNAFTPNQLKSAIGNKGTYDFNKPDVRASLGTLLNGIPNAAGLADRLNTVTPGREDVGHARRMIEAINPKNFGDFRTNILNRYNQMAVHDKMLAKTKGLVKLMADASAEAAALMSDLASGIAAEAIGRNGGVPVYKNGYTSVDKSGKGLVEIFAPLAKLNNPEMYRIYQFWAGAKRARRLIREGREENYTPADLQHAKEIEKKYGHVFNKVHDDWIKYNNGLVKYQVDTGVLSPEKAKEFSKYSDYIPFYRQIDGDTTVGPQLFQSMTGVKAPKKLKGGEGPLADLLETVVRNTHAAIQSGTKNVAATRAVKNAEELGLAEKVPFKQDNFNTVKILENGKEVYYEVSDPLLVQSMQGLNLPDLPFLGILAAPANWLRNMVTKEPGFMLANMMKDSISAYITSGSNMTPVIDTVKHFTTAMAGTNPTIEKLRAAGIGGGHLGGNIEVAGRDLAKKLRKEAGTKTTLEKGLTPFTSLWEGLEHGTEASDLATRAAIYQKTMDETGNEAEAIYQALEVMNFYRKGANPIIRILSAVTPFLNARIQGLDVFYRAGFAPFIDKNATEADKARQKAFFVRGATIMALSAAYWALTHDDDDYKKQEQETRDNNWLIPSLGVKIPIPFEVGFIFKVIPERALEYFYGNDTGKDFLQSMKRGITSTLAVQLPQVFQPAFEATTNYSFFTGRDIVPQGLQNVAPEYQVGPSTTKTFEAIGKELGQSPIMLEHLWKGYTGTMGMYMVDAIDSIINLNSDVPKASKRFEQMPFIKRFALDPEARGSVSSYYDLKDSVDQAVRTSNLLEKTGNYQDIGEYMQENAGLLATDDYVKSMDKSMKELQNEATIVRSSGMSADEKRDALKAIGEAQNALTANVQYLKKMMSER